MCIVWLVMLCIPVYILNPVYISHSNPNLPIPYADMDGVCAYIVASETWLFGVVSVDRARGTSRHASSGR